MRNNINQRKSAREYDEFVRRKVERARTSMRAANGRAVTLKTDQPLHLDHAYATTAHSAQGLTCERVLYNAETTSRTTAQDTYYVSISRERHDVVVFTDDIHKLPDAIDRVPYKGVAHDLQQTFGYEKPHSFERQRTHADSLEYGMQ